MEGRGQDIWGVGPGRDIGVKRAKEICGCEMLCEGTTGSEEQRTRVGRWCERGRVNTTRKGEKVIRESSGAKQVRR
jgi:hypothetical protein